MRDVSDPAVCIQIDFNDIKAIGFILFMMPAVKGIGGGDQATLLFFVNRRGRTAVARVRAVCLGSGFYLAKNVAILFFGNDIHLVFSADKVAGNNPISMASEITCGGVFSLSAVLQMLRQRMTLASFERSCDLI